MNKILKEAIKYLIKYKWNVFPLKQNKKPYFSGIVQLREKLPTVNQLKKWWKTYPDAMIGIITGKPSGLTVIDADTVEGKKIVMDLLPDTFIVPMAITPRGGFHLYFKYKPDLKNVALALPGVDIRSEGGYVVAPPSKNYTKQYYWTALRSPDRVKIPEMPEALYNKLKENARAIRLPKKEEILVQGRRDDDLFHTAYCLVRAKVDEETSIEMLTRLAQVCKPPYPERLIPAKVQSALNYARKKTRNLSQDVKEFIEGTTGVFSIYEICRELSVVTQEERKNVNVILHRLTQDNFIERAGYRDGRYRRIETKCIPLNLQAECGKPIDLKFPFSLEKLVDIYPKNIIVIAGVQNAGKTTFFLDFIKKNMKKYRIHYFNSEMGEGEFGLRLSLHEDIKRKDWKFNAYERTSNFQDVIIPNEINILDYVQMQSDKQYEVGDILKKVYERLGNGVVLVGIQKESYKDLGRGAGLGLDIPRLYITLDSGKCTIIKAKNWVSSANNPNGLSIGFKIVGGWKILPDKSWRRESA